ncbi:MAG: hypothetical protein MJZ64_05565, partial [Paludibacteraceae bacterium]|nr:hypothetical protein [Paludibacteraceae bacterium]
MKKALLVLVSCMMVIANVWGYESAKGDVPVNVKVSNSNRFMKLADGCYTFRGGSYSYSDGKGIKTQNTNGGVVFYVDNQTNVTVSILHSESKNAHTVTCNLYTITEDEYKVLYNAANDGKTSYTFKTTTASSSFTIDIAATNSTFTGTTTVGSGFYALIATGDKSNTYFSQISFASAGPSDVATLKALTVDGIGVDGFSADLTSYSVELRADYSGTPTVAATTTDGKAKADVTQATAVPGTATINVTAEDGTTKKEYKITFTKASSKPKVETATWDNITAAGATVDNVNMTITGKIKYGTGLTAIKPTFTGKNIASWTPNTATDFSGGAVKFTFTNSTGETTDYMVTITEADPLSSNAFLSSIKVNGTQ